MKKTLSFALFALLLGVALPAIAEDAVDKCPEEKAVYEPIEQAWPQKGVFGMYDKASLQRGFQVYKEVCSACHSMKQMSYRHLEGLGYTPAQIKALAAEYTVTDLNEDGETVERKATPADSFKLPFPNDQAARAANNGALPPDMSLLAKAREHGEDYIYSVLNGYEPPPACATMLPGMNWNKYFPGHKLAMAKPLSDGQVAFGDGTKNDLQQEARDVAQFLAWASEPHMEDRKAMGIKVMIFMLAFCFIMCAAKRKIWADVH